MGLVEHRLDANPDDEQLQTIDHQLKRMNSIVEDVLTLTRRGDQLGDVSGVSLATVARDSWEAVETGDATLTVEDDLCFWADPDRVCNVFENLFRNAVDHGGDTVSVTVGTLSDRNGVCVADDGPGIPAGERADIFQKGYTTATNGTGLGLEIVCQIADAHEWTIEASESDSGGARFELTDIDTIE